jgi:hypothetical protein
MLSVTSIIALFLFCQLLLGKGALGGMRGHCCIQLYESDYIETYPRRTIYLNEILQAIFDIVGFGCVTNLFINNTKDQI